MKRGVGNWDTEREGGGREREREKSPIPYFFQTIDNRGSDFSCSWIGQSENIHVEDGMLDAYDVKQLLG
jgi:hypothetical protein